MSTHIYGYGHGHKHWMLEMPAECAMLIHLGEGKLQEKQTCQVSTGTRWLPQSVPAQVLSTTAAARWHQWQPSLAVATHQHLQLWLLPYCNKPQLRLVRKKVKTGKLVQVARSMLRPDFLLRQVCSLCRDEAAARQDHPACT